MKLLSDYELMLFVNRFAKERNIKFSPAECAFFVSLAKFTFAQGAFDEEKGAYFIQMSCRELSLHLECSTTFVFSTLQKLDECGLVERVHVRKEFCPLGDGSFSFNKPSYTYMDLSLFCSAD